MSLLINGRMSLFSWKKSERLNVKRPENVEASSSRKKKLVTITLNNQESAFRLIQK